MDLILSAFMTDNGLGHRPRANEARMEQPRDRGVRCSQFVASLLLSPKLPPRFLCYPLRFFRRTFQRGAKSKVFMFCFRDVFVSYFRR